MLKTEEQTLNSHKATCIFVIWDSVNCSVNQNDPREILKSIQV